VLVFYHLPQFATITDRGHRVRDAAIALTSGGVITALVLVATNRQFHPPISAYFTEQAIEGGHSRNVVNIVLTDFRALDSLGEMTVLALAGIGVYALLKRRPAEQPASPHLMAGGSVLRSMILQTATRMLMPLLLLFSIFLLIRGHNEPGGGFVGGLVAAVALILYRICGGPHALRKLLPVSERILIATGLALACGTGVAALLFGLPFLTSNNGYLPLGAGHYFHWATVMFFDAGVFLVVVGVTVGMIDALSRELDQAGVNV
jgi:multicomponent K+:H+ antiporter subunit A